jgi:hypothetical protein
MLILDPETIGVNRGFVEVGFSPADPKPIIRTLDQYYHRDSRRWKTGSMFTSERFAYSGRVNYRRPVTLGAKLVAIFPGWFLKVWRRKVAVLWRRES